MATLTIKNIPDTLYQGLKNQAALHRRSLNSEVIISLEYVLKGSKTEVQSVLKKARALRKKSKSFRLTDKVLKAEKEKGRV